MMPPRSALLSWLGMLTLISLVTACERNATPREDEQIGASETAIINGDPDQGHPMVVAYLHDGSLCSATIVEVKGSTGYALTAAHCIGAQLGELRVGSEINNSPTMTYPVTATLAHPGYKASTLYDVAMLKFTGASAATPSMPPLPVSLDNLSAGTTLDLVGYGKTTDAGGQIGAKHHKFLPIGDVTPLRLLFDQKAGGLCSGDSGGPSTFYPALEYVAGVHSYVASDNGSCLVQGADIRVSPYTETFIKPFINGQPTGPLTCAECTEAHTANGLCSKSIAACYATKHCPAYQTCIQACKTNGCIVDCKTKYAAGATLYTAIETCICDTGCATECAAAPFCNVPQCGLTAAKATCQSCFEASCCAEAAACAANATCIDCESALVPGPNCKTNPQKEAYDTCLATNCADACQLPSGSSSSGSSGTGSTTGQGGGDATTTTGTGAGAGGAGAGGEGPSGVSVEVSACSASLGGAAFGSGSGRGHGSMTAGLLAGFACLVSSLRRRRPRG